MFRVSERIDMKRMIFKDDEWCRDCAEGWDGVESLGVALCPLHAAAPELLEALESMLFDHACDIHNCPSGAKARAAIAKAKGHND